MWKGVLFKETKRDIFFSSDLMFQLGETHGEIFNRSLKDAIKMSGLEQLHNSEIQSKLKSDLESLNPIFVASGRGQCINVI